MTSERASEDPTRPSPALRALELRETSDGCEAGAPLGVVGGVISKDDLTRPTTPIRPRGPTMRSCRCPADESSCTDVEPAPATGGLSAQKDPQNVVTSPLRGCDVEEGDPSIASVESAEACPDGPGPLCGSGAVGAAGGCTTNWSLLPGGGLGWTLSLPAARRRR